MVGCDLIVAGEPFFTTDPDLHTTWTDYDVLSLVLQNQDGGNLDADGAEKVPATEFDKSG